MSSAKLAKFIEELMDIQIQPWKPLKKISCGLPRNLTIEIRISHGGIPKMPCPELYRNYLEIYGNAGARRLGILKRGLTAINPLPRISQLLSPQY